jgi:cobyrinic acid ac-diamide synthase
MKPIITFFNNKGGVGKTTLTCNFAHRMASRYSMGAKPKVLVIDADPQANATQLLIDEETWESIYTDRKYSYERTIMYVFKDILLGNADVNSDIYTYKSNRFEVDVLAGHPTLSTVEDIMANEWGKVKSDGNPGAIRKSNWLNFLNVELSSRYDAIVIDAGPSLGALNRSILLGSTYFVTPLAPDLFSLYSLENIGNWVKGWGQSYKEQIQKILDGENPVVLQTLDEEYKESNIKNIDIVKNTSVMNGYIGYTIQQYVARSGGNNTRRKTKAYEEHIARIPEMSNQLKKYSSYNDLNLGTVPQMFSMIPLAQLNRSPISTLTSKDGLNGSQFTQQKNYTVELNNIFDKIIERISLKIG